MRVQIATRVRSRCFAGLLLPVVLLATSARGDEPSSPTVQSACVLDNRLLIAQDGKPPYLVAAIGGGSTGTVEPLGKRDWIRLCSGAAQVEIRGRAA